ncbi:MAG: FAD-dependent oxidoreductase [Gemmatimonadales bacterium]|nr:FAD-dependent oxidoreductase [Gemmatimonadales bacterium]
MTVAASGSKAVLVLGGGVGGLVAANRLRKLLPPRDRIVLVDREPNHVFQPSLLWLATGSRDAGRIQRPLARLERKGIEVVQAEVTAINPEARTAQADGRDFAADAMIVALGADLAPDAVPGLRDAGHNLYTVAGAAATRDALAGLRAGRVVVLTAAPAYKCPAAPYEAAMLIQAYFPRAGRGEVRVDLYAAEPGPMGVAGPAVSAAVRGMVEASGIGYHPNHQVTVVDPAERLLTFANGVTTSFDVLVYVPPHRAPEVVRAAGLTDSSGWIGVDRRRFETSFPGVHAIGDVTSVPLAMGKPLPKAGVFAHRQAEVVAHNIAEALRGEVGSAAFDGFGKCWVEVGNGRAGYGAGDFYAEPTPDVRLRAPSLLGHWSKVWFERHWLWHWF